MLHEELLVTPYTDENQDRPLQAIPFLSITAQQRAMQFILEFGTNLQRERLLFHFPQNDNNPGSNANVLAALSHYQNEDGGFGHGLEADLRTKQSTVISTTLGLQILDQVGAMSSDIANRALEYLGSTYKHGTWQPIHEGANDAPHAPWWKFDGERPGFQANPTAEILKYLILNRSMPGEITALMTQAIEHITEEPLEMHELLCFVRLYECDGLSHDQRIALRP